MAGDRIVPFFVVMEGVIEIVRPFGATETVIAIHGPGEFTGEANMLSGRRTLVRARAAEDGQLVELTREQLLALVQRGPELGHILPRAFILRRAELIANGMGDVVVVGSAHCPGTLRVREFLTRNGHRFAHIRSSEAAPQTVEAPPR